MNLGPSFRERIEGLLPSKLKSQYEIQKLEQESKDRLAMHERREYDNYNEEPRHPF